METAIATMRAMRAILLKRCGALSQEELHRTPEGFNSPLAWHLGHVAVTSALLVQGRCGLEKPFADSLIDQYKKGTGAADIAEQLSLDEYAQLMEQGLKAIEADHAAGRLGAFEAYETSAGVPLTTAEGAVEFLAVHDGIHVGYVLSLARALG